MASLKISLIKTNIAASIRKTLLVAITACPLVIKVNDVVFVCSFRFLGVKNAMNFIYDLKA